MLIVMEQDRYDYPQEQHTVWIGGCPPYRVCLLPREGGCSSFL